MDWEQPGGEPPESDEAPPWRPPVICPNCGSNETRFVEPRHEMSVYECGVCQAQFEEEE